MSHMKEAGVSFEISYVRSRDSKNGPKGSIKTIKCLYGAPNPKGPRKSSGNKSGARPGKLGGHVLNGTLPLTQLPKRNYITPLISHIIALNGVKIKH